MVPSDFFNSLIDSVTKVDNDTFKDHTNTKVITNEMDQQDILHVPPDVRIVTLNILKFFCKNTTFDTRITSDLLFRLMTLTDKN